MITMCLHERRDAGYSMLNDSRTGGSERIMKLDYFICESIHPPDYATAGEDAASHAGIASYGVKVTRTEPEEFEEASAGDVTCDFERAKEILRLLADNCVTPCCLREALEDICASEQTIR